MIHAKGIRSGESSCNSIVDEKRESCAQTRHEQLVFSRRVECGKVRFPDLLVTCKWKALVRAWLQTSAKYGLVAGFVDNFEFQAGGFCRCSARNRLGGRAARP